MLGGAKTLLLRAWESIQSQKSVDEIKIQVTKLIQVYSIPTYKNLSFFSVPFPAKVMSPKRDVAR